MKLYCVTNEALLRDPPLPPQRCTRTNMQLSSVLTHRRYDILQKHHVCVKKFKNRSESTFYDASEEKKP